MGRKIKKLVNINQKRKNGETKHQRIFILIGAWLLLAKITFLLAKIIETNTFRRVTTSKRMHLIKNIACLDKNLSYPTFLLAQSLSDSISLYLSLSERCTRKPLFCSAFDYCSTDSIKHSFSRGALTLTSRCRSINLKHSWQIARK